MFNVIRWQGRMISPWFGESADAVLCCTELKERGRLMDTRHSCERHPGMLTERALSESCGCSVGAA